MEKSLLGSKKHGLEWEEGAALAKSTQIPQGQFGSEADLQFALSQAEQIGVNNSGFVELPPNNDRFVFLPDGTVVPATKVFIKVYPNGKVHTYPIP